MKKTFITTIALMLALPTFASAQLSVGLSATTSVQVNNGQVTEAQLLTACSQAAIEIRDSAISSARTAYNNSMTVALDARKEAEKKAVALTDADTKKDAIKTAVESYKKDVTQAQDALTKARKEAWSAFETNTNDCRDMSKDKKNTSIETKKIEVPSTAKTMQAEVKAASDERKGELKSLRETFKEQIDSIKAFFGIGTGDAN